MYRMNQFIAGIFFESRIVNLLPHPQVFDRSIIPHPTLDEVARAGDLLFLSYFRQRDISVETQTFGAHLLAN